MAPLRDELRATREELAREREESKRMRNLAQQHDLKQQAMRNQASVRHAKCVFCSTPSAHHPRPHTAHGVTA